MRARWLAAVMPLLLAGCGSTEEAPAPSPVPTFAIMGTLEVFDVDAEPVVEGESCTTSGGFVDIQPGAQVTVTSADGSAVALGSLEQGEPTRSFEVEGDAYSRHCGFPFTVSGVPDGGQIYGVEVAGRGVVRFERAELEQPVVLSLT